ncbi:MAG: DEAD/DEAH box helicase [Solirubrobacteraceae bacterium]
MQKSSDASSTRDLGQTATDMAGITISLREDARQVQISLEGDQGASLASLEHALLLLDADRRADGFWLPVLDFRRAAVEIARELGRTGAPVHLDEEIVSLLRTQIEEIQARPKADEDLLPLPQREVLERISVAGRFKAVPNERQISNLARLLVLRHGANFSVPGAGKTLTLLAVYEDQRTRGLVERLLVVAPKNAFIAWEDEITRCFDESQRPEIARLTGGLNGVRATLQGDPEIALITYQQLVTVREPVNEWVKRHRTQVTLDESHRVKSGHGAVTAAAALELSGVATRRDILSGTPLPQSAEDLRPQLDFLWPGQRILPEMRVLREGGADALEQAARAASPLYVRTTKAQLNLPELHVHPVAVPLGPLQHELYELLRSEAARAASGMGTRDQRLYRLLGRHVTRLLQAAVNPMLLTQGELVDRGAMEPVPEGTRAWELLRELARYEQPAKVATAIARTEELVGKGEKVLIWTQFVMNVRSLERLLAHHGAVVLYGKVPAGDEDDPGTREGRIRRFHEDDSTMVMIANPAAAGEGISLHQACHRAIYLDRSFNAAHYLQSVDRIHRLGGDSSIEPVVEILDAQGTVDARVNERLTAKLETMGTILNDEGLRALAYDPEDVQEEFLAGIEPEDVDEILAHLEAPAED